MPEKTAVTEPIQKDFSKAQAKHFNELQGEFTRAQAAFQKFADYLSEEHELTEVKLPAGWGWQIGPKGFVAGPLQQQGMPMMAPPEPQVTEPTQPPKAAVRDAAKPRKHALAAPMPASVNGDGVPSEEL